jgi:hypothetical protein
MADGRSSLSFFPFGKIGGRRGEGSSDQLWRNGDIEAEGQLSSRRENCKATADYEENADINCSYRRIVGKIGQSR